MSTANAVEEPIIGTATRTMTTPLNSDNEARNDRMSNGIAINTPLEVTIEVIQSLMESFARSLNVSFVSLKISDSG